jgi:hypothetical protein
LAINNQVALYTNGNFRLPKRRRPAMIRPLLAITAALATAPAFAQMPDYDTARHCTEFAKGNRTVENDCRRNEADARWEIERGWVAPEVLAACTEQVRAEQSYVLLFGCILNDVEARTNQKPVAPIPVGPTTIPVPDTPMNVPVVTTGPAKRPTLPAAHPGGITVMRGSQTTIEIPTRR